MRRRPAFFLAYCACVSFPAGRRGKACTCTCTLYACTCKISASAHGALTRVGCRVGACTLRGLFERIVAKVPSGVASCCTTEAICLQRKLCRRVSPEPGIAGAELGVGSWVVGVGPAPDAGVPVDAKVPCSQANCTGVKGGVSTGVLVGSVIVAG